MSKGGYDGSYGFSAEVCGRSGLNSLILRRVCFLSIFHFTRGTLQLKRKQDLKYDHDLEADVRAWIEETGIKLGDDFQKSLKSGVKLCKYAITWIMPSRDSDVFVAPKLFCNNRVHL